MNLSPLARILPAAALACAFSASADEPVTDKPEGHWTGTLQCAQTSLGCVDLPVIFDITSDGHDRSYTAKLSYVTGGTPSAGPTITFFLNPEHHTLTAHYTDFSERQFWALKLDGDGLGGVRLVNEHAIDRFVYLTRDK